MDHGPALSLDDLETEFEKALRRLRRPRVKSSFGQFQGLSLVPSKDSREDWASEREEAERRLHLDAGTRNRHDRTRGSEHMNRSSGSIRTAKVDTSNEALLEELRGIQLEIEAYAKLRAERKRLAKSMPLSSAKSGMVSSRHGEKLSLHTSQRPFARTQISLPNGQESAKPATSQVQNDDTARRMEGYFEEENQDLGEIVERHFNRVGVKHIQRVGEELSQRREQSLLELREALESRNTEYIEKLREQQEVELEEEKLQLKQLYDLKLLELEEEINDEFNAETRSNVLEAYRAELDHAIREKVERVRNKLYSDQKKAMDALSKQKLAEREKEIQRVKEVLTEEYNGRKSRMLQDLEDALREGGIQAREALEEQLEKENDAAAKKVRMKWADRREVAVQQLTQEMERRREHRLRDIDREEEEKQNSQLASLRMELEENLVKEISRRTELSKNNRASLLTELRSDLERKHKEDLAKLEASLQKDLDRAKAQVRHEVSEKMKLKLDEERSRLTAANTRRIEEEKLRFAATVEEATAAFKKFQEDSERNFRQKPKYSDSSDESDDGVSMKEFQPPARLSASREGETAVMRLIRSLCDSHRELSRKLAIAQEKLAGVGEELILSRKSRDLLISKEQEELKSTKEELRETKRLVQTLFSANESYKRSGNT